MPKKASVIEKNRKQKSTKTKKQKSVNKKTKKEKSTTRITRKQKRGLVENFKFSRELLKLINHFFPDLIPMLKEVADPRKKGYIKYETEIILFTKILASVFHLNSMRSMGDEFNNQKAIDNIYKILGDDVLSELPHYDTINNFLCRLDPKELENIVKELVVKLIRMRSFETSRVFDKYWQILIDGTGTYDCDENYSEHCLTKTYNKGTQEEYTIYYHYVLEAKLVFFGDIVISIATEFVENESPDVEKQDCEIKAFYRLSEKIKSFYPRLPICLTMDSLYAKQPVFDICVKNKWQYIIVFKEGSIKTLAEEFVSLKNYDPDIKDTDNEEAKYIGVNKISYNDHYLNVIEYAGIEDEKNIYFVFISSFLITKKNYKNIVYYGRLRWTIENQGFNEQKNHGFFLEHIFSEDYNAMKNHYYLIQIAHMIDQIFEKSSILYKQIKISTKQLFEELKRYFLANYITDEDIEQSKVHCQVRFT